MNRSLVIALILTLTGPALFAGDTVWQDQTPLDGFFVRADVNHDGLVDQTDVINLYDYQFNGTWSDFYEYETLDVNDDGWIDITDVTVLYDYLCCGGPAPAEPYGNSGTINDAGYDCTPGDSQCRLSPLQNGNQELAEDENGDVSLHNVYTYSSPCPNDWEYKSKTIFSGINTEYGKFDFSMPYGCYDSDTCDIAATEWWMFDDHFTTRSALVSGTMSLFVSFWVDNIEFEPDGKGIGSTSWCTGIDPSQPNLLNLANPEVIFYFQRVDAAGNPSGSEVGIWYSPNDPSDLPTWDSTAPHHAYVRADVLGGYLDDLDAPYDEAKHYWSTPVYASNCFDFSKADASALFQFDACQLLKLTRIECRVDAQYKTLGVDITGRVAGKTPRIKFNMGLSAVHYEYPNCSSHSTFCGQ